MGDLRGGSRPPLLEIARQQSAAPWARGSYWYAAICGGMARSRFPVTASKPLKPGLVATARSLAIDGMTAEVLAALENARIPAIVLKGPSFADWLYDDGAPRAYNDSDLLVAPADFTAGERVLESLGFVRGENLDDPGRFLSHAEPWRRPSDGALVDLHRTLTHVRGVAPEAAWLELSGWTEPFRVGEASGLVLNVPARALLVALHAAHHGPSTAKPIEDLGRALERVADESWAGAATLARQLDAEEAFANGLRMHPAGAELAERLDLPSSPLARLASERQSRARMAAGVERLVRAPGLWGKLALARRELLPSAEFLRWSSPLARRGRLGLAVAYLERPLVLAWKAPASVLAWRRLRRGRESGPRD